MKILRISTLLDFGGQEKQYVSFTDNQEVLKHEYVFASIGHGGNAEKTLRERGFDVHILNCNFSIKKFSNIWKVFRLIKKIKPDVVHTAAAEANFHGIIAAKLAGVKVIIGEEIGIPNHSQLAILVFGQVYKLANKIICVSNSVKNHLIDIGEIPELKGEVIYNPVSFLSTFPKTENESFNIVYVGRLEKVKNVETLIKVFSKIDHDNVKLTIVGDGREKENLKVLVRQLGLHNVYFIGYVETPAIYISQADLFVLPSYSEGFGIAAVEAMFLKVPVLCSNVGGIPEFLEDGVNGWLFNPNDINELAEKLNHILNYGLENLKRIGETGYNSSINRFTVDKYVKKIEKFYIDLCRE